MSVGLVPDYYHLFEYHLSIYNKDIEFFDTNLK